MPSGDRHRQALRAGLRSMLRIFVIFLVTQLPHSEALRCYAVEYEINGECCPMCSAGSRVFKHCTRHVSTTCMPCVDDTYTEHPNGLTECMRCKVCFAGARLMVKEKCMYTVCGCALGDFCPYAAGLDCEMCSPYTVCLPGSMVKEPESPLITLKYITAVDRSPFTERAGVDPGHGPLLRLLIKGTCTEFSDNVCEVCPDGTFSATNMSHTCQPWTRCEEEGMRELKAGTATSDAVCVKRGLSTTAITLIILVLIVPAVAGAVYFFWWKKKTKGGVKPAQETGVERSLIQSTENGTKNIPTQEQTKARAVGEERKPLSALHV